MDANISTAALMVWVSSAWLHLSFPPFPACILQSKAVQMCSPIVTPLGPGQSVTVGKRHYSHAYLLKERAFGTSLF